ncbi:hypothetical protein GA0074694_6221 [Micromonospora inyonensis]|uniref:Uncharacterized protein n=1 Tax=Micromonospora inyonensis TaxID=47866 RepID=A0A1C6SV57_9ACTN|nr:hypothetical protein GA0074694_1062 [Micromonospora inyonensis]SCL33411.1 hypothetical protein GA0074694_6221 [Micromonospora inyonensis]
MAIPETRHHCYVKPVPFRLALLTLVGRDKGPAAGRLLGMEGKTIDRALDGGVVSEALMANALAAFDLNADKLARVGLAVSFDQFFKWAAPADDTEAAA